MSKIFGGIFKLFTALFSKIGWAQMILTEPRWLRPVAGWVYVVWFIALAFVPALATPWLEARWSAALSVGVQIGGAVLLYVLALGLVVLCFRHDGEEEAARRGLLTGQGEFVNAVYEGEEGDPKLRLESPYARRLGWVTLLGGGLGLALAFALFCQGLHHAGLTHWFATHRPGGGEPDFGEWVLYSLLNVFRALDFFDTLPTYDVVPPLVRHQGLAASSMAFVFKAVFDFLLLAKLRGLLGNWFLYRRVAERTDNTAADERGGVRRSLSATLQATGDWFVPRYVRRFVGDARKPGGIRRFARQILAGAGLQARIELAFRLIDQLQRESTVEAKQEIMAELGGLYLYVNDLAEETKSRAVIPKPRFGQSWDNGRGIEFVGIEPGTFVMGWGDEAHKVTLTRGFCLGKTPLTQAQFEAVTGFNPSYFAASGPDAPVEQVSWKDARAFLLWLSLRDRREGVLPADWCYRLPTEAEWEYACRAGSTTAAYGYDEAQLGDYAWYNSNSDEKTHPVGQKKPNAWGLYDIHGNVTEWCHDGSGNYDLTKVIDPQGPALQTQFRVSRGGSYDSYEGYCRPEARDASNPSDRASLLGFRPVLSQVHQD